MPAGANAGVNANTNTDVNANANTNANTNTNTNTNANTNTNVNANTNTNTNANTNVNAQTNTNLNANANVSNIDAQSVTRINQALGLTWADTAANAGLTIGNIARSAVFGDVGFTPGDQIVSIGGQTVASPVDFARYLYTVQPGQRVPIVVTRNGSQQTLYWTPDQQFVQVLPQEYRMASVMPADPQPLGITVDERQQQAVVVADVAANSPAAEAGVRPGDMITAVNRTPVNNPAEFINVASQLGPNDPVQLSVSRVQDVNIPTARTAVMIDVTPIRRAVPAAAGPNQVIDPRGPVRRALRPR